MLERLRRLTGGHRSGPLTRTPSPESDGYHDDIPMRVRDYVLEENEYDCIEWMTTACEGPPKRVVVSRGDGGWSVETHHPPYHSFPVPSLSNSAGGEWSAGVALRRCLWHARQLMEGRTLNPPQRGELSYFLSDPPAIEDVDLFFDAPDEERENPFGDYLRDD